ncbi:MAG: SAM-dependent methyltransferase, partial [Acidimicrobiales bacterium]
MGLGPGAPDLITEAARARLHAIDRRFLRTTRHPSAGAAEPAISFDGIYKKAASLDEVYASIVEALVDEASVDSPVLYAVPGSPLVGERSVEL